MKYTHSPKGIFLRSFCLALLLHFSFIGTSQDPHVPAIIPPTPEAHSITRFVDMPSNYFSGRYSKDIPLYQLKDGELSIPISLSYSTGGFRVQEDAGWVGLGWNLNAGGAISRTVIGGIDDWEGSPLGGRGFLELLRQYSSVAESYGGIYNYLTNGPNDTQRLNLLQLIAEGCYDSQPDLFAFNFNGISGTFNFNWLSHKAYDTQPEPLVTVDSKFNVKIEAEWSDAVNNKGTIIAWTITTPDGYRYKFEEIESTEIVSSSVSSCFFGSNQSYNSAWYLTEITNVSGNRHIRIEYQTYVDNNRHISLSHSRSYTLGGSSITWCAPGSPTTSINSANTNISGVRPSRIYSSHTNVEVLFGNNANQLDEISIKDGSVEKMKWNLSHGSNLSSLSQVNGTSTNYSYSFEYHLNNYSWDAVTDHWGFANDGGLNGDLQIPAHTILDLNGNKLYYSTGTDKNPNYAGSVAGAMKKITFPTGGYELIDYELNDAGFVGFELLNGHTINSTINANDLTNISLTEISEYERVPISIYGLSVGQQNQSSGSCSSTIGTVVNNYAFSILTDPSANPPEPLDVTIIPDIDLYTDGPYFGGAFAPKVEILNSLGSVVATYTESDDGDVKTIGLMTGNYTMRTSARFKDCNQNYDKAAASLSYSNYTTNLLKEKSVGGVRVKSIEKKDAGNQLLLKQSYVYEMENGFSSGVLSEEPNYVHYDQYYVDTGGTGEAVCERAVASNSPYYSGRHHGYKRVVVTGNDGTNGKTIYNFLMMPDQIFTSSPYQSPNKNEGLNGLLMKKQVIDTSNQPVYEEVMEYGYNQEKTSAFKVVFKGGLQLQAYKFDIGTFSINNDHASETKITKRFLDSGLEEVQEISYDTDVQNVTSTETVSYDGNVSEKYFYVNDYSSKPSWIQTMSDNHQVGIPIETITVFNDGTNEIIRSGSFKTFSNGLLDQVNIMKTTPQILSSQFDYSVDNSGAKDTNYELQPEFDLSYDANDNITSIDKKDDVSVYVWGYGRSLPVISLQNATQTEVDQLITAADNTMLQGVPSEAQVVELRNRLASQLPSAMVSGFVHDPVYGILKMIDQNGQITSYEYDLYGRLKTIRDSDDNLLKENEYNYGSN